MKIIDGGFGTTLRDVFNNKDTTIWSLKPIIDGDYHLFKQCHQLFIDASADILITGNYCATPYYLEKYDSLYNTKHQPLIGDYIEKTGEIAYNLKKDNQENQENQVNQENQTLLIAGSIPPYAESYTPNKLTSSINLIDHYKLTANSLDNYCDFYLAETISSYREGLLIYQTLRNKNKPLYLSFTIGSDGISLLDGTSIFKLLQDINYDIDALMFNCSPIDYIDTALSQVNRHLDSNNIRLPLGAYPNRHREIPQNFNLQQYGKEITIDYHNLSAQDFKKYGESWYNNYQISYLGGCCGITPEYIKEISSIGKINY